MNAGKTTTAAGAIRGLPRNGLKVGAAKVTGTGSGGDRWAMLDAGAAVVLDFTDAGHASTFGLTGTRLTQLLPLLISQLAAHDTDAIVLELSDGLFQQETASMVESEAFARLVNGVLFAADGAMGAKAGADWLRERGRPADGGQRRGLCITIGNARGGGSHRPAGSDAVAAGGGRMVPDRGLAVPRMMALLPADGIARTVAEPPAGCHLFLPDSLNPTTPLLVCVHGISRNAEEHLRGFAPIAAAHGVAVMAPVFAPVPFPDYQRLGRQGKGLRADIVLQSMLQRLARQVGLAADRIYLFGHSGGAQFVHRYAMAYPAQVARYVVSAAGWYTLPDPTLAYPFGTGTNAGLPGIAFDPPAFLRVPGAVLVGTQRSPARRHPAQGAAVGCDAGPDPHRTRGTLGRSNECSRGGARPAAAAEPGTGAGCGTSLRRDGHPWRGGAGLQFSLRIGTTRVTSMVLPRHVTAYGKRLRVIQSSGKSWPELIRPATPNDRVPPCLSRPDRSGVDGQIKPGHDRECDRITASFGRHDVVCARSVA